MRTTKEIFITGIAGFIGFHLARALHRRGDRVRGCDNFNAYYAPALKQKRKVALQQLGIDVIACDITDARALREAWDGAKITHCVHLAAQAGVRYSNTHPEAYIHSNLVGLMSILERVRSTPGVSFLFASSSSVYGTNAKVPFAEDDPVDRPASLYGATKRIAEEIVCNYHRLHGIPSTVLRFFTVYGPWGRPDMAYFSFAKALVEDKPIPVYGEGKLMRDSTYIDDIVDGILAAIDRTASWDIFNLGAHQPHSVLEMVSLLEEFTQKKAQMHFLPAPVGDVSITYADGQKSQRMLGFSPKVTLREGLQRFVDWFLHEKFYTQEN